MLVAWLPGGATGQVVARQEVHLGPAGPAARPSRARRGLGSASIPDVIVTIAVAGRGPPRRTARQLHPQRAVDLQDRDWRSATRRHARARARGTASAPPARHSARGTLRIASETTVVTGVGSPPTAAPRTRSMAPTSTPRHEQGAIGRQGRVGQRDDTSRSRRGRPHGRRRAHPHRVRTRGRRRSRYAGPPTCRSRPGRRAGARARSSRRRARPRRRSASAAARRGPPGSRRTARPGRPDRAGADPGRAGRGAGSPVVRQGLVGR